ncbi:MAG TPA: hypothetical protein VM686_00310 [Polyangiaceae bacterium]|jgi:hypothetical protein|nr:hypothetical protein [Polyangiaceae bacterium]
MRLSKVVFANNTAVFGGDTVSVLIVPDDPKAPRTGQYVDSIEVTPLGLLITRGDVVAWVPHSKAEGGQVIPAKGGK